MTQPRRNTVYDYSNLTLHPDGRRVHQKSSNLRPKLAQSTVQDGRLNWIAKDAGGTLGVGLFRRRKLNEEEDMEKGEGGVGVSGSANGLDEDESGDDTTDKKGKRRLRRTDPRTLKRQKFLKNDNFLADEGSTHNNNVAEGSSKTNNGVPLPHPSPDLLKCIHRFASEFYTQRGQLLNTSRQYRKEKKERRIKRAMEEPGSKPPSSNSTSSSESNSKSARNVNEDGERPEEDGTSDGGDIENTVSAQTKRRKRRKGRHRSDKLYVDMYKVFDGSAMMALGMLVQEQIAHLLDPSVPESWETDIRAAYTDPWGESLKVEDEGKGGGMGRDSGDDREGLQGADNVAVGGTDRGLNDGGLKVEEGSCRHSTPEKENMTDDEAALSEDTDHSSSSKGGYH